MPIKGKIETVLKEKKKSRRINTPDNYQFGRPTKYRDEFAQDLLEHMGRGLSFDSFAGYAKVNQETLYAWIKKFPNFSKAYKDGKQRCLTFWENLGAAGILGLTEFVDGNGDTQKLKTKTFNTGLWIYNMKVRFGSAWVEPDKAALIDKVRKYIEMREAQERLMEASNEEDAEVTYVVEMTDGGKFVSPRPQLKVGNDKK